MFICLFGVKIIQAELPQATLTSNNNTKCKGTHRMVNGPNL